MDIIARIYTDFPDKFGVPRQSGLVDEALGRIVFEPEFRDRNALVGIEDFSHIWLIWEFSKVEVNRFMPTVRPPRLGGNKRMGVFATRSPFRPNRLGLSSVKLLEVIDTNNGPELIVAGVDMVDGTPIYDIKPYLPHVDSHPAAKSGFVTGHDYCKDVCISDALMAKISEDKRQAVIGILKEDPRPAQQHVPDRIYGMRYADYEIRFKSDEKTITVTDIIVL